MTEEKTDKDDQLNQPTARDSITSSSVLIHLRSVGEAAALKKAKFKINGDNVVNEVDKFLRKQLKYEGSIYLYCGSGFSPTPDQKLQELYEVIE
jgi:hypothetical protein